MKKSKDRHLDVPAEARRNNHVNFLAQESGDKDPSTDKEPERLKNDKDRKSTESKTPSDMDVQEGNIKHDPDDPHGLKTKDEKHDRQK